MTDQERVAKAIAEIEESLKNTYRGIYGIVRSRDGISEETLNEAIAALRAQEQNEPLTECEFCLGCATEHGFYISKGALFYLDSQLGAEGIEIRYCPICGRNLNLCESEHAPEKGEPNE